jgi:hypothetical protein
MKMFFKEKPTLRWKKHSQNSFQKPLCFEKEILQESQKGHNLIREYHSEVIFGLTFPQEEKEYKHGNTDKFSVMRLLPTASIALHDGLFSSCAYSGCIHGIHHRHVIHKHDSIIVMVTYIQLCEVLWKQNAGTKEHKKGARGLRPWARGG